MRTGAWIVSGLVSVALVALGSGCFSIDIGDQPSRGELGNAEFSWDQGAFGCMFGCDAGEPMAVGAVANLLVVNDEELPAFTVSSTDGSVIFFSQSSPGSSYIQAEAHREGQAKVILTDDLGEVVDRLAVDAYDVASVELMWSDEYRDRYTIMVGGEDQLELTLRNSAGKELIGIGAVDYTFEGGVGAPALDMVSALADFIVSMFTGSITEYVTITANELDSGTLIMTAVSGASLVLPVDIVDGSAVTDIDLVPRSEITDRGSVIVDAEAWAGNEPVHSPLCAWTFTPADAPVEIEWFGRDNLQVAAVAPTQVQLHCDIGSTSGTVELVFP